MSMPAPNPNAKPPGPLRERQAFSAARREDARGRDAARYRLAEESAARARLTLPRDQGFLVLPPGVIKEAEGVVVAGNALIDSIGHDLLTAKAKKGGFMAFDLIPDSSLGLDSPYMQFALSETVVDPIVAYLGFVPVLAKIDVWYSVHDAKAPQSSQLWHLDHADVTQVKVLVNVNEITTESGPMTALDAATSDTLADRVGYDLDTRYRVTDEEVAEIAGPERLVRFEGPAGTVNFIDTSRCFHFGSRVGPDATPRRLLMAQYLTPYSFKFADHRTQAAYRELAADAAGELQALLLGAS
jgi:hypothetical protein